MKRSMPVENGNGQPDWEPTRNKIWEQQEQQFNSTVKQGTQQAKRLTAIRHCYRDGMQRKLESNNNNYNKQHQSCGARLAVCTWPARSLLLDEESSGVRAAATATDQDDQADDQDEHQQSEQACDHSDQRGCAHAAAAGHCGRFCSRKKGKFIKLLTSQ